MQRLNNRLITQETLNIFSRNSGSRKCAKRPGQAMWSYGPGCVGAGGGNNGRTMGGPRLSPGQWGPHTHLDYFRLERWARIGGLGLRMVGWALGWVMWDFELVLLSVHRLEAQVCCWQDLITFEEMLFYITFWFKPGDLTYWRTHWVSLVSRSTAIWCFNSKLNTVNVNTLLFSRLSSQMFFHYFNINLSSFHQSIAAEPFTLLSS